ncbi:N-acylglucosamine 2-epimerase [Brevundimonas naejangsanensis]|uniref:N-acylglucosamine 2-epimerase n=1 Tax=Brevundimonas naejangsanensis TaxID=588932 RepID=A0A172Y8L5_9CAUL|nr:AGE family epimerase/isomerase [Brevundimonas naejangsanensis]ANF55492.1 N-acylglucosamine 2-epimerase [Brevundimonas naejangsanensis]
MRFDPAAKEQVSDWLFGQALPLWARAGVDADGRFYEKLDFSGRAVTGAPRRTRVQARQIHVFAEASALGWSEGEAIARAGLDALIDGARRDDGLWVRATDDAGAVIDATPDLYDLAFVLFALAGAHRVLKDERARPLALETLTAIEAQMADPEHGGWQEALPPVLPRRQNPHMHMLEALLAWQATAPDPAFETAARSVLDLFNRRFFDREHLMLGEFYGRDWSIRPGSEGQCIEPGHHMEWVWLLSEAARLGLPDHGAAARALYTSALTCGVRVDGLAVREIDRIGRVRDGGVRLWAQTELLRALHLRGDQDRAARLVDRLFETHLATPRAGLWFDAFDADGRAQDAAVPASTFYHLMTAFSALLTEPS